MKREFYCKKTRETMYLEDNPFDIEDVSSDELVTILKQRGGAVVTAISKLYKIDKKRFYEIFFIIMSEIKNQEVN